MPRVLGTDLLARWLHVLQRGTKQVREQFELDASQLTVLVVDTGPGGGLYLPIPPCISLCLHLYRVVNTAAGAIFNHAY